MTAESSRPILCVVGARPNYMKIAPLIQQLARRRQPHLLVHTGQHYDDNMSGAFFRDLGMPEPDMRLGIGSDSHARQTAKIMTALEQVCLDKQPSMVIVGGDVNSTLAAAVTAAKLGIPVAHVEAGLRSFDRSMPEEINRIVTDHLSELLFTTEESGNLNLRREGIPDEKIRFVGNCMVDTLLQFSDRAKAGEPWTQYGLAFKGYALATLHRPTNVDGEDSLRRALEALAEIGRMLPVLFPAHPRTQARIAGYALKVPPVVMICDPISYISFIGLMSGAKLILTDSGGIQEESTTLNVPCLTMRSNTERPVTVTSGSNRLVGADRALIAASLEEIMGGRWKAASRPPLWDGHAAERAVDEIERWMKVKTA